MLVTRGESGAGQPCSDPAVVGPTRRANPGNSWTPGTWNIGTRARVDDTDHLLRRPSAWALASPTTPGASITVRRPTPDRDVYGKGEQPKITLGYAQAVIAMT